MPVASPEALNMVVPAYGIDQIIGITTGTLTTGTPTLGTPIVSASANFAHGFGDSAYFSGIFSADNGTTWNDFGAQTPTISLGTPVFQTVGCTATCDTTNLTTTASSYFNFITLTGAPATVIYKVYLFAKNVMASPINPLPTAEILQYSSSFNYQKIYMRGTANLTVATGATGSVSVLHSLGYIPIIRAYRTNSSAPTLLLPLSDDNVSDPQAQITDTVLTFFADESGSGGLDLNTDIQYRIYVD